MMVLTRIRNWYLTRSPAILLRNTDLSAHGLAQIIAKLGSTGTRLILEIGANTGQDTVELIREFPNAMLVCFEPDQRAIEGWKRNVSTERAKLHSLAIGDIDDQTKFYPSQGVPPGREEEFDEGYHLSGSLKSQDQLSMVHPWLYLDHPINVDCMTLDRWCDLNSITQIDLLWMDVQGAEDLVLSGARETLRNTKFIKTEYHNGRLYSEQPSLREILKLLPDHVLVARSADDIFLMHRDLI